jgi:hypothetical protein
MKSRLFPLNSNSYQSLEADEIRTSEVSCTTEQSHRIWRPVFLVGMVVAIVSAVHFINQAHDDTIMTSSLEEVLQESCVATYSKCGGGDTWRGTTECCDQGTACYSKDETYAQCRFSCPDGWKCEADRDGRYKKEKIDAGKHRAGEDEGTTMPSATPSVAPSSIDTASPTVGPTHRPTRTHLPFPTPYPTQLPTVKPTHNPSVSPTSKVPSVPPTSAAPMFVRRPENHRTVLRIHNFRRLVTHRRPARALRTILHTILQA